MNALTVVRRLVGKGQKAKMPNSVPTFPPDGASPSESRSLSRRVKIFIGATAVVMCGVAVGVWVALTWNSGNNDSSNSPDENGAADQLPDFGPVGTEKPVPVRLSNPRIERRDGRWFVSADYQFVTAAPWPDTLYSFTANLPDSMSLKCRHFGSALKREGTMRWTAPSAVPRGRAGFAVFVVTVDPGRRYSTAILSRRLVTYLEEERNRERSQPLWYSAIRGDDLVDHVPPNYEPSSTKQIRVTDYVVERVSNTRLKLSGNDKRPIVCTFSTTIENAIKNFESVVVEGRLHTSDSKSVEISECRLVRHEPKRPVVEFQAEELVRLLKRDELLPANLDVSIYAQVSGRVVDLTSGSLAKAYIGTPHVGLVQCGLGNNVQRLPDLMYGQLITVAGSFSSRGLWSNQTYAYQVTVKQMEKYRDWRKPPSDFLVMTASELFRQVWDNVKVFRRRIPGTNGGLRPILVEGTISRILPPIAAGLGRSLVLKVDSGEGDVTCHMIERKTIDNFAPGHRVRLVGKLMSLPSIGERARLRTKSQFHKSIHLHECVHYDVVIDRLGKGRER